MNINSITINKITDNFCFLKKAKCVHCKIPCRFNLDGVERLTSKLLKEELKLHSHPTSRVINKMNRNKEQEKIELLNHYKTVHFLKWRYTTKVKQILYNAKFNKIYFKR